jgi:hypothetical protein
VGKPVVEEIQVPAINDFLTKWMSSLPGLDTGLLAQREIDLKIRLFSQVCWALLFSGLQQVLHPTVTAPRAIIMSRKSKGRRGRQAFNDDLEDAATPGRFTQISSVMSGDEYGSINFQFQSPSFFEEKLAWNATISGTLDLREASPNSFVY